MTDLEFRQMKINILRDMLLFDIEGFHWYENKEYKKKRGNGAAWSLHQLGGLASVW